jgi:acyl-CoA synthetase (AMP-forming)/AMP-acid ligase II
MLPPSIEFFALAFALLRTGIVPILVDPVFGLQNVKTCFEESKPEIYFGTPVTHLLQALYGWGKATIKLNVTTSGPGGFTLKKIRNSTSSPCIPPKLNDGSPAAIIYTGGSTGLPKGAVYTHANFAAQIEMLTETFNIRPDEIDLPAFPLFALIDCLVGITALVPDMNFPSPAKVNTALVVDAVHEFGVDNMFASPIMLDKLVKYCVSHDAKLTSLKRVITAGAPAPVPVLENFRKLLPADASLYGIYGATETLPVSVIESREVLAKTRYKSEQGAGVCIGRPAKGSKVRIIAISDSAISDWSNSLELPVNQVGEITVKGPTVTCSYIGRPEADRLAKIKDGPDIIHRMGDLGFFDEQGRLWYCGRKSQRVETSVGTLFTEQIEGIFNAHPLVYRTALVGVNNEPVLWVQLVEHARHADRAKIKQGLLALGANHEQAARVKTFLFHTHFPTDGRHNSKIIREKLTLLAQKNIP